MGRRPKEKTEEIKDEKTDNSTSISFDGSKDLELRIAAIHKKFGQGSIMTLGNYSDKNPIQHLSSGSLELDVILGKGGFPFGRVIEIYGPESSGKTTLLLEAISRAQSIGLQCAFIDMEHGLNPEYAKSVGVNLSKLHFAQPMSGQEALEIIRDLIPVVDVICLDSIAALAPEGEIEKEMTENPQMGQLPVMLSRFFRVSMGIINKHKCLLLATNQIREKVGIMFGNPETCPGGRAMKFYATQRLDMRVVEKIQDSNGDIIGQKVKVKTVKNKMNSPYKECNFDIIFGKGIDKAKDLLDIAVQLNIVEKAGASWYSYHGENIAQGLNGFKEYLGKNPNKSKEIRDDVVNIFKDDWGLEGKNG